MTEHTSKPRWLYRLDNYVRALTVLRDAVALKQSRPLSTLEKAGLIQSFEFTWEIAWNLLKDYLAHSGVVLETITPAAVIKAAFAAGLITQGEQWMRALDARNKMSHTYDLERFELIVSDIEREYFGILDVMASHMQQLAKEA